MTCPETTILLHVADTAASVEFYRQILAVSRWMSAMPLPCSPCRQAMRWALAA